MSDKKFPEGVRFFTPHSKAPDFVIGSLVITPNDLVAWLKKEPELLTEYEGKKQIKLQVLKSKEGKPYLQVDTFKKDVKDEMPF